MRKNRFVFILAAMAFAGLLMFFACLPVANAGQQIGLQVEGSVMKTDPAPFFENHRVMVPVRELADALRADVSWNEEQQSVTITQGELQTTMFVGKQHAVINGKDVQMDVAPVMVKDRTMVPLRFLAEGLQVPVSWDDETQVVSIDNIGLLAGSELTFPPFEFIEDDKPVGFEIDLIQAIAEVSGEKITVKNVRFDQLIPSLLSGEIDLLISGMSITEHRKQVIDFTMPYFEWGAIILNAKGGSQDIALEDLAGKKIACQSGSYTHELVSALVEEQPTTQLKAYETLEDVLAAVEEGTAEAAVVEHPSTAYYLTKHPDSNLQLAGKPFAVQSMGIAVQKDNQELLEKLDKGLQEIMENGTYDRLYEKWFGPRP